MFGPLMLNTWIAATIVAGIGGIVGFFVVLRGSTFAAHAIPQGAFAGAAAASLLGVSTIAGLGVFAAGGALGIGLLGRRGRHDVATALALVLMLGLGALFLSFSTEYAPEIYSLLFGEVLGVSRSEVWPIAALGALCLAVIAAAYRPLLLSSVLPDGGAARGLSSFRVELLFLLVVALATAMTVPVVGALLIFTLMVGPPAAARALTARAAGALSLSAAIALAMVWASIAASYLTNWPVGFFVGASGAVAYGAGRAWAAWRRRAGPPGRQPPGVLRRSPGRPGWVDRSGGRG
jgi:zinc/manganese transport system permease protein